MLAACVKALEVVRVNTGDMLEACMNNICSVLPCLGGMQEIIDLLAG